MLLPLRFAARHGRLVLIAGLLAGLFLPSLALALRPWLPHMIAALLALTAMRIGAASALGGLSNVWRTVFVAGVYQLVLPSVAAIVFFASGVLTHPLALSVVLLLAAPPVTGSPNFTVLVGRDPAPALRLLVIGTAIFPITVLPVLWFGPVLDAGVEIIETTLRLVLVIAGAVAVGFALRPLVLRKPDADKILAVDGAAAILLGVVVIGLMSALGPALEDAPLEVGRWLMAAFLVNFGLQFAAAYIWGRRPEMPAWAICAGNRNIALFLIALPPEATAPLLIFIGCYQIPMYLTPLLMRPLYRLD